jgi:hypothetical protein
MRSAEAELRLESCGLRSLPAFEFAGDELLAAVARPARHQIGERKTFIFF